MQSTTHTAIQQRPTWKYRPGTYERAEALRKFADALGEFAEENHGDQATEHLYDAMLDLLDYLADDLRGRRAAR